MKALEVEPLKGAKLTVLIVEKEYNEPFWISEPTPTANPKVIRSLFKSSIGFYKFLENLTKQTKQDFVTDELGMRSPQEFRDDNILAQLFRASNIPYFSVDIGENAKGYLAADLDRKKELRDGVLESLDRLSKQKAEDETLEKEYLIAYGQSLQAELEEKEHEADFQVRENWIVMGILEHAREIGKKEITCVHLSSPEHVENIQKLLQSLDVRVETLRLSKKIITTHAEGAKSDNLQNALQAMQIQVTPIIKRVGEECPYLLFYLDTDEKASPFDICMAYDAGYDAVIPYENVSPEDGRRIVQDALFSRGPKGVKHTNFFIGGKSAEKAEEVLKMAKGAMFSPFKTGIIIDPAGAYTTATAMVAKLEQALSLNKLGELGNKSCAVLGTGSVGQIAAVLLAKLGCEVSIVSLSPGRKDGEEYADGIAKSLSKKHGVKVRGVYAPTSAERLQVLQEADVILCAGTRGVQLIDKAMLKNVKLMKVMVDINAVQPFGVEGLELKDNMKEIAPGIFGIGALTVGDLKYRLEREILSEARLDGDEVYNYSSALTIARKLLQKELVMSNLALTLSYPAKRH